MAISKDTEASFSGNLKRRKFLLTTGLGIGGAVAAAAGVKALVKEDAATPLADQPKDKGYQASEHVRKYYRSARV
ncbi:MAG: formate dehydrogenase [Sterolibacterium sp.]|jgi:hypothetical protein